MVIPVWLNDVLGVLFTVGTIGALFFFVRQGRANRAVRRGQRNVQEELASSRPSTTIGE
jgi:hypothetical protein